MSVNSNSEYKIWIITKLKQTTVRVTFYFLDSSVVNYRALQLHRSIFDMN